MSIPAFSVRQPVLVNLVAISAVLVGAMVMSIMHRESLPTLPTGCWLPSTNLGWTRCEPVRVRLFST